MSDSLWPHGLLIYSPWNSSDQNTGVDSLSLLQGIFPTQGSNPGLQQYRWILYQLSHKGSPRILKWVAHPFSRGTSQLRNRTRVSCITGGFFDNWATREALVTKSYPTLLSPHGLWPTRPLSPWDFLGKKTRMGCHFLLQGIFLIQRLNLLFLHWQADSLPLSPLGSPYYPHITHKETGI